jgi:spore protease
MVNFRTDLASERRELYRKANQLENEIEGIESESEQKGEKIKIERVKIINEQGEQAIGKPRGNYITIDIQKLKLAQDEDIEEAGKIVSEELKKLIDLHVQKEDPILVVGLGNIYVTPDALGPKVINEIEVTRHVMNYMPQYVKEGTRMVSAISPGVLGTTGIETAEILKGIVDNVHPKLLIVIDALASRSIERISSTVQLSDTGIVPGAGVGNKRSEISQTTMGIPVIAMGIPTVVETAVLVNDSLDLFIEKLQQEAKSNDELNQLKEEDNYEEIREALIPKDYNLIVTPKEIDDLIENMKEIVASGINMAV